jgi:proteasome lid subunit RPN8/RPN11
MEEIRAFACDELLQLSHGGNEVGGVLFGTRRDDLIRILTWRPMACDHTQGEGLRLSYNDRMNLAVQLEVARQNPDLKDLRPVGWFVSHSRGDVFLSDSDLEIYNGFFPEAWQAALVICPKGSGRAQAGFFMREADAKVQSEASYQSFELAPLHPADAATKVAVASPPEVAPPPPPPAKPREPEVAKSRRTPKADLPAPPLQAPASQAPATLAPPAMQAPAMQAPATLAPPVEAPALQAPSFQIEEQLPTRERWFWAIPILLALGIAAFMLYQRQVPSTNASIALRASTSEGQTVQLAWDANSRAIRDSFRGEIAINDGGKSSQVSLTSDQLHAGKMSYLRQSSDVGFALTVYPTNGEPIHDSTRLIAPVFDAPTQPPQLLPASPVPASPIPASPIPATQAVPPAADESALQQQVQQLKEDVGKERARADELQNLVRILENRLGIQSEPGKSAPHH